MSVFDFQDGFNYGFKLASAIYSLIIIISLGIYIYYKHKKRFNSHYKTKVNEEDEKYE